jgi:hypothetical protein
MKTINFPYDVMTVNIYDERDVFLEVKPIEPGLPPIREVLINIGFFVCENNTRKYIDNLDPPAEIHVKFPDGEELKLAYFDKGTRKWEDFPIQKSGKGYVIAETSGWPDDPSIGWR